MMYDTQCAENCGTTAKWTCRIRRRKPCNFQICAAVPTSDQAGLSMIFPTIYHVTFSLFNYIKY